VQAARLEGDLAPARDGHALLRMHRHRFICPHHAQVNFHLAGGSAAGADKSILSICWVIDPEVNGAVRSSAAGSRPGIFNG